MYGDKTRAISFTT